jgi:hypothetical protein
MVLPQVQATLLYEASLHTHTGEIMTNSAATHGRVPLKSEKESITPQKRSTITREQIQARAYEIYISRGNEGGAPVDDWLQAERELQQDNASTNKK